jgi:hypothetical protein
MKPIIAVPLGVAGILAGIGTAIANANGWFIGHPHLVYWCWGGSFIFIVVAVVGWIFNACHTGETVEIEFTSYELHRTPEPRQLTSIFLRVKIELAGVRRTIITRYRMELSCVGVVVNPEFRDDVDKFEITDWSRDPIPHDDMRPLPKELSSGNPVEGWVHFITDWNENKLYRSYVRLFADTARGSGSLEIRPGREYWNAVQNRMIVEKRFGSISLDRLP